VNVIVNSSSVEFVWSVFYKSELQLGSPWGRCVKLLSANEKKVIRPRYSDTNNLKHILQEAFKLYDDFADELLKQTNQ
jgi:hypothetical protein